ncbi:MAG: class I SAM-dependent methyltransferase [Promethearchaeota archaeon]
MDENLDELKPTERFSDRVANYIRYRPSYPEQCIVELQQQQILSRSSIVADIGSGTGKFTSLLLQTGRMVYGIEPNDAMRKGAEELLQGFSNFHSVAGKAESTGLLDNSVDLITVAQAFHWFHVDKTRNEFQRILKPGGWVVFIWNERPRGNEDLSGEYERLLQKMCPQYLKSPHLKLDPNLLQEFMQVSNLKEFQTMHFQELDKKAFLGRVFSSSYTPKQDTQEYLPFKKALEDLFGRFQKDGIIQFPYLTRMYFAQFPSHL